MLKKLKILLLLTALFLVLLAGLKFAGVRVQFTTGISSKNLFKADGQVCSLSEGRIYLANMLEMYKSTYGEEMLSRDFDGVTAEDFLKENVIARLSRIKILNGIADEQQISLEKEEKELARKAASVYWQELGSERAEVLDVSEKEIEKMYQEYLLAEKTFTALTQEEETEISEDEARIIVVWHIYFKTYDKDEKGTIKSCTKEEKELVFAKAEKALQELEAGADFAETARSYSDDEAFEYEIGRGEMPREFDDVAFELEAGELSGIVETPYGFHIIKCISDFEEGKTKLNKERLLTKRQFEAYEDVYNDYAKSVVTVMNEKGWEKVLLEQVDLGTGSFFSILENIKGEAVE